MKKITLTILLMMVFSLGFSQVTNYNFTFEPTTPLGTWSYFDNGSSEEGVSFVANPFPTGINTSATVGKFTASADGGLYAGFESLYGTLGKWKFDGANPTVVTIDIYKTTATPIMLKFTSSNTFGQGTVYAGEKTPSAINQWVTVTFVVDFAATGGVENADNNFGTNQIAMHVDLVDPRADDQVVYFDNIKFTATKLADPIAPAAGFPAPTVHAPTPPNRNAFDVVSLYSGAYTPLEGVNLGKNWGAATNPSDIIVDGDATRKLLQFNYQGIEFGGATNLTGFEKLHVDFYKTDQGQIKLSIINVGGGDITKLLTIGNPGWNSFDILLSDFAGLNLTTAHQIKLEGAPVQGNTTVYFDNMYFYKGTDLKAPSFKEANISMYPNPVKNSLNIEAKSSIKNISVYNVLGQKVIERNPNTSSTSLTTSNLQSGVYIIKANVDGKISSSKFVKE